jgi:hypothetical protein
MSKERISTGFQDKKGKEIFIGDTIKYKGSLFDVLFCNGAIKLMEKECMFNMKVGDFFLLDFLGRNCRCIDKKIGEFEIERRRKWEK